MWSVFSLLSNADKSKEKGGKGKHWNWTFVQFFMFAYPLRKTHSKFLHTPTNSSIFLKDHEPCGSAYINKEMKKIDRVYR